jgi:hypothetical protein
MEEHANRSPDTMKWKIIVTVGIVVVAAAAFIAASVPSRWRFAHDHGIQLPSKVIDLRMCGDHLLSLMDHGRVAFVLVDAENCQAFLAQLNPDIVATPCVASGDPAGPTSQFFPAAERYPVPSNKQYTRLRETWGTNAVPVKAFGGRSSTGDHLRVEHWRLADGRDLLKVYTDWN